MAIPIALSFGLWCDVSLVKERFAFFRFKKRIGVFNMDRTTVFMLNGFCYL